MSKNGEPIKRAKVAAPGSGALELHELQAFDRRAFLAVSATAGSIAALLAAGCRPEVPGRDEFACESGGVCRREPGADSGTRVGGGGDAGDAGRAMGGHDANDLSGAGDVYDAGSGYGYDSGFGYGDDSGFGYGYDSGSGYGSGYGDVYDAGSGYGYSPG